MRPSPAGFPRISSCLSYDDPKAAIAFLCEAFGFELRLLVEGPGGSVVHSELVFGDGLIMVGGTNKQDFAISPNKAGGNTQSIMVYVDDVEAHLARARARGAKVFREPAVSDYGAEYWSDRTYGATDCEGHRWWFSQRISTGNQSWGEVRNKHDRE